MSEQSIEPHCGAIGLTCRNRGERRSPLDNPRDAPAFAAHLYSCLHHGGHLRPCGRLGN